MEGKPKQPRPPEEEEVSVNMAGIFVGMILFVSLVWAIYSNQMTFAYLNAVLLAVLAVANHVVNMVYE
jgi:hypothetical protein